MSLVCRYQAMMHESGPSLTSNMKTFAMLTNLEGYLMRNLLPVYCLQFHVWTMRVLALCWFIAKVDFDAASFLHVVWRFIGMMFLAVPFSVGRESLGQEQ
jgi:hypothetical protein